VGTTPSSPDGGSSAGLSTAVIIAIAACAGMAGVALVAGAAYAYSRRRQAAAGAGMQPPGGASQHAVTSMLYPATGTAQAPSYQQQHMGPAPPAPPPYGQSGPIAPLGMVPSLTAGTSSNPSSTSGAAAAGYGYAAGGVQQQGPPQWPATVARV
jgi:hypothetical protein